MRNIVTPFLMFEGKAEEAINFYVSLIPDTKLLISSDMGRTALC